MIRIALLVIYAVVVFGGIAAAYILTMKRYEERHERLLRGIDIMEESGTLLAEWDEISDEERTARLNKLKIHAAENGILV